MSWLYLICSYDFTFVSSGTGCRYGHRLNPADRHILLHLRFLVFPIKRQNLLPSLAGAGHSAALFNLLRALLMLLPESSLQFAPASVLVAQVAD